MSLAYFKAVEIVIMVHGTAEIIGNNHPDFKAITDVWLKHHRSKVSDWSDNGIYKRINPNRMCTLPKKVPGAVRLFSDEL